MRISDWSSDVCSSDLRQSPVHARGGGGPSQSRGRTPSHARPEQPCPRDRAPPTARRDSHDARHRHNARAPTDRACPNRPRSEEHTSELQSLMRISYAVFCLKKKNKNNKKAVIRKEH